MRKFIFIFFSLIIWVPALVMGQAPAAIEEYISTYKDLAISEMIRTGVPAAIKLAQGIHETSAGESELVLMSNNHFGIKCKTGWSGESVRHDDDARQECFRKYDKAEDSYRDHSDFLKNSQRYAFLFNYDPMDYESWARGLKKAGYATNPKYPQIIIKLIEDYNLNDYTLIALGRKTDDHRQLAQNNNDAPSPVVVSSSDVNMDENEEASPELQYPVGEFKINDTKVIFVKKGTSFLTIATQYDIPLARIFDFNEMQPIEIAAKDQLIYLQRKRKTGHNEFHVLQRGETLSDVAQVEAIRMESLLALNGLSENQQPAIGEKLYLKSKAPSAPRLTLRTDYSIYNNKPADRN